MKKIIIWLILAAVAAAAAVWLYLFYFGAKHKDPLKAKMVETEAVELYRMYESYEDSANVLYLGKVIKVSGKVANVEILDGRYSVSMETGSDMGYVVCEMDTAENSKLSMELKGSTIQIAGFCNGINLDVYLDRCKLAE